MSGTQQQELEPAEVSPAGFDGDGAAAADGGAAAETDEQVEAQARRMGWLPQAEFRGDPKAWRPASEFIDRGMSLMPVLRQQYGALDRRYGALDRRYSELERRYADTQAVLVDLSERTRRSDERAYQRAQREVEARRTEAVANGDTESFRAAEAELTQLRETAPPPVPAQRQAAPAAALPSAPPPEVSDWIQRNTWLQADTEAREEAVALHNTIMRLHPEVPMIQQLEMVRERIARLHPHLFENPRRAAPSPVGSPTAAPAPRRSPHSFDAMPQDSKDAFARYQRALAGRGKALTKEEWAKTYWEQES